MVLNKKPLAFHRGSCTMVPVDSKGSLPGWTWRLGGVLHPKQFAIKTTGTSVASTTGTCRIASVDLLELDMTYRVVEVMDCREYSQFEVADRESGEYLGSYLINWESQIGRAHV